MFFASLALLSFLLHSLLLCLPVCAIPHHPRQADGSPKTVTSVTSAVSPMGTLVFSCKYVFTSVKDEQGGDVVRQVKTCVLALGGSRSPEESSITTTSTSSSSISTTTATLPPSVTTSSSVPPPSSITIPTPPPPDPVGGSFSTTTEGIPTISTVPPVESVSIAEGIPTTSTTPPDTPTSPLPFQTPVSGIAAAAESSMPGKKLAVLPIGLGVFAGISVIALIVVGIVTYERTKYRKVFRKHKLAEEGAQMGYGGMVH